MYTGLSVDIRQIVLRRIRPRPIENSTSRSDNLTTMARPGSLDIQCESKKSPLRFCGNFSKTVGNFSTKFYVPIVCSYPR